MAKKTLCSLMENTNYPTYELDVVAGKEGVIPIYESVGFQAVRKEKERWAWLKGFSHRVIMTLLIPERLKESKA